MAASGYLASHDWFVTPITTLNAVATEYGLADIGGTNAQTAWVSMAGYDGVFAIVFISTTWNAADDLDECRLEQATDSSGTNAKDLTDDSSGSTTGYDTANPVDATGDFVILEAKAEDLDVANSFTHVRLYIAEGGNTGVDNALGFLVRYRAKDKLVHKMAAPVTGSKVYVKAG